MPEEAFDIGDILRTSGKGYGLDLFSEKEIKQVKLFGKRGLRMFKMVSVINSKIFLAVSILLLATISSSTGKVMYIEADDAGAK